MRGRAKVVPTILILTAFSFCLPCIRGSSSYVDVTVSEAKHMIDSDSLLVILDVRTQSEYNSGHIRNARLIPHTELEARIGELDEHRDTLVYCRSGYRSVIASEILIDHGFTEVYNMLGGILAWTGEGYPVYVRYESIQQAVNNASVGDTIFVSSGIYNEHLVVNKSLTLLGESRNATVIDGGDDGTVVCVRATSNVAVRGFTLQRSGCMCKGYSGVSVEDSHSINVTNNLLIDNGIGIKTESSYEIVVARNDIIENFMGISVRSSVDNVFYHNDFVDNYYQAVVSGEPTWDGELNTWDNGYASGGNYWSDYTGLDLFSGPYQNETGSDGTGDTPYIIDENNRDNYPLMKPYIPHEELRVLYYELLENYNNLLADYRSLNSTYYELLHDYSDLLAGFDALNASHYDLLSNHTRLQGFYDLLSSSYSNLNTTYNESKSKQEATINELNTIRNLMYIFIGTTIILIATTVYLARRRPKS